MRTEYLAPTRSPGWLLIVSKVTFGVRSVSWQQPPARPFWRVPGVTPAKVVAYARPWG